MTRSPTNPVLLCSARWKTIEMEPFPLGRSCIFNIHHFYLLQQSLSVPASPMHSWRSDLFHYNLPPMSLINYPPSEDDQSESSSYHHRSVRMAWRFVMEPVRERSRAFQPSWLVGEEPVAGGPWSRKRIEQAHSTVMCSNCVLHLLLNGGGVPE